jgi:sugar (pentulose or hexulose) kinase
MRNSIRNYLALDFGAESGRAIIVTMENEKVTLKEIHRFPNKPSEMNGTLYWDLPFLFREIITSLKMASQNGIKLESLAVDTWGVDFGLIDSDGELLSNPVHYRDKRTDSIKDFSLLSDEILFKKTGGLPWNIASLFQLYSLVKKDSAQLKMSNTFLNTPDLFNFLLCGVKASEKTIASTSIIMDTEGQWCEMIEEHFNLPPIFPEIVKPATVLGRLRDDILKVTGEIYKDLKVLTTCSHDTASVAAIVPDRSESSAFLSSGTWSILGKIFDQAQTDLSVLEAGFTNEASLDSWYLCKNITGLYPFQELKRFWDLSGDPWEYSRMCEEASSSLSVGLVDLEHKDFQTPGEIVIKIEKHLKALGFPSAETRGDFARIILRSLALEYAVNLEKLERLSSCRITTLYILGGGIKNEFLCQRTADMCGVKVIAGIDQGTALGNGLVQAYGLGHIESPEVIRRIASASFEMKTYEPVENSENTSSKVKYKEIKDRSSAI